MVGNSGYWADPVPSLARFLCGPPGDDSSTRDGSAVLEGRSQVTHFRTDVMDERDRQRNQGWGQHGHEKAEDSQVASHCSLNFVAVELNSTIPLGGYQARSS